MANEEPLVVMKAGVNIMREVIGKDGGDSRGGVVGKGETSLRRSRCRGAFEGALSAED